MSESSVTPVPGGPPSRDDWSEFAGWEPRPVGGAEGSPPAFRTAAPPEFIPEPTDRGPVVSPLGGRHIAPREAGAGSGPLSDEGAGPTQPENVVHPHHLQRSRSGESAGSLPPNRLPSPGDRLFAFRLRRELGRGAFARVFLAEQTDLAGRPVVVKVSAAEGSEHRALAQLQHTNIVPIFSVHEDAGVRALCMPYFGGTALSMVLRGVWEGDPPTQGAELVEALDQLAPPGPDCPIALAGTTGDQTPRRTLSTLSYVRACTWIVARLAEGLHHAHQRGILHRDVKPSNVLLAADGQPMLLDFNLAQSDRPGEGARLGGTVAYMSPEHLRAMMERDPRAVDHRSDIYSLGMILFEMLAGQSPSARSASTGPLAIALQALAVERGREAPSLRRARPDVPWGLESVVRKCLAPVPADRYQRADDLAEDLRRLLADQPLRHARELSLREQVRKWARRHPRASVAAATFSVAAVLLLGAGLTLSATRDRLAAAQDRVAAARAEDRRRAYREGTVRALFLVNTTADLRDHLRQGRAVCEETLALYGVVDDPAWQDRPDWQRLAPEEQRELSADTQDLLLLLAGAKVRLAPEDPVARAEALALLDRAEAIPGLAPCRALWEDRAVYLEQSGDTAGAGAARARAAVLVPTAARDHYLLAMTAARLGRYDLAVRHLDEAVRLNPRHYWSWLQRGLCHLARGEPALAVGDFGTCVGLRSDFAWGYFNRGCALAECGKLAEAVDDYTAALDRDPELIPSHYNRALLELELGRNDAALADFQTVANRGRDDASVHSGRGVALERLGRHPEADEAFRFAGARAGGLPREAQLRLKWVYGFAVARRAPAIARVAFDEVLREEAENPQALYGRGMLFDRDGQNGEALTFYTRAVEASPGLVPARRARAVVLARLGRVREAGQEINVCLDREPRSGPTLYAAACVAALASVQTGDPTRQAAMVDQAISLLQRALDLGYGREVAATDPDLNGIRSDPRAQQLLSTKK